jgi:hypothetical protein
MFLIIIIIISNYTVEGELGVANFIDNFFKGTAG